MNLLGESDEEHISTSTVIGPNEEADLPQPDFLDVLLDSSGGRHGVGRVIGAGNDFVGFEQQQAARCI